MLIKKNIKRIWFITDTHLGVRNNSNEWMTVMQEYFYNWFIPTIKSNYQPGDILVHLGDVYDSRQSLNIKILNFGVELFEEFSKIFVDGVYVIAGNHDLWTKDTNDINSLVSLKWIPNINILQEPLSMTLSNDRNILFMPWRKNAEAESEVLNSADNHDILCCHTDIRGLKFNKFTKIENGTSIEKLKKFKKVYCGHIHYGQESDNITILGSPYELTRSDMDNTKSIVLLSLDELKNTHFVNTYSPQYKKMDFNTLIEMTPAELEPIFNNNYIDIMIDSSLSLKAPLSMITDIMTTQRDLKFHPYDSSNKTTLSQQMTENEGKVFNVLDFIKKYVDTIEDEDVVKSKMINSLNKLYEIVTNEKAEI